MAEYQQLAYAVIRDIHARQKLPLLVGGTGQYITAVIEGWSAPEVPPNPKLRAELAAYAAEHGALALFERLRSLDPVAAERMDPYNSRRTVRALEVCLETGRPFSEQRGKNPPPYRILQLGLTLDRAVLYERIDRRIEAMMEAGLLEEVRNLRARGYDWSLPSMSGLGYAQLGRHLRGEISLEEAIIAFKADTRTFVRRQYTWFRKYAQLQWLDAPDIDDVLDDIRHWLRGRELRTEQWQDEQER
jgi:tRNA dimethylallyltransferase